MTHERCSELLRDYVGGELPHDQAAEVRAHLAGCEGCRAEERSLAALAAAPEPLDDVERARLHRALTRELFTTAANADVAGVAPAAGGWRRWIAPAAGAAAVLLGLAFAGMALLSGGDDSGDTAALRAPVQEAEGGGGDAGGAAPDAFESDRAQQEVRAGDTERTLGLAAGGPQPEFARDVGALTPATLSEIGRSGGIFSSFSAGYQVQDAQKSGGDFLDRLADAAGPAADEVRECGATMPRDGTVIAAYGATGEYEGEDVLVLGFVTSESGDALDRYVIWVWARGSCEQPIDTLIGDIDR